MTLDTKSSSPSSPSGSPPGTAPGARPAAPPGGSADSGAETAQRQRPLAGVLFILAATALIVSMDAIVKTLVVTLPTGEVVWGRFLFHALFVALFLNRRLPLYLRSRRPGLQLVRSACLLSATVLFFTGLRSLGLATASAIMFTTPLLITLLSMPVLGERVGWRRMLSVAVGFVGALAIVRPGTDAIGLAALLPVGAALANAGYQLSTRLLARADPPLTTLVYTALVGALLSSMALPFAWVTPTPLEWGKLMATGLLGAVSHFALIKAFSLANAAVVAPFTYTSLLWATLLGFLLFGDFPDLWTVAGAALIVGSGLYILYREGVKRRERERAERGAERGSAPAPKTGLR